jgi:hypothetical protein
LRFGDRFLGVIGEVRRDFEAHVAIIAASLVVNGAQDVGSHLNVLNRERLVKLSDRRVQIAGEQSPERDVIVRAAGDGFVKNRWIAGNAP